MNPTVSVSPVAEKAVRRSGTRESALFVLLAGLLPMAVHALPWSGMEPIGATWLPMFCVTLAGVHLYGLRVGLLVGISAPFISALAVGFPKAQWIAGPVIELALFAAITRLLVRRSPGFWWSGPFAFAAAKAILVGLGFWNAAAALLGPSPDFGYAMRLALPGMVALSALHLALVKLRPAPEDWDAT